jgi:hypothetical protein
MKVGNVKTSCVPVSFPQVRSRLQLMEPYTLMAILLA